MVNYLRQKMTIINLKELMEKIVHKKTAAIYTRSNTTHRDKEGEYKI